MIAECVDDNGHHLQEVNIVIKRLWDKFKFSNKFTQNCFMEVSHAYGANVLH